MASKTVIRPILLSSMTAYVAYEMTESQDVHSAKVAIIISYSTNTSEITIIVLLQTIMEYC